jgi:DNA-binding transcriptional MocR family regulator
MLPGLEAVARASFAASGIPAAHVCLAGGALDGIERVFGAQLAPGDRVAVEDPGYSALFDLLRALGLEAVPVRIDERGPLPGALAAVAGRIDALVVTPRGQNPLGAAVDAGRAAELRTVLAGHPRVLVIEDDHLGAVSGAPHHPIAGDGERWAVVRSVAKSLGPDLRLAYLAGDATTIGRVEGRLLAGTGWISHILQGLVLALETDAATQRLLERAAETYAARRAALAAELAARGIPATGASGLQVWIPVEDEDLVCDGLREYGYAVARGARYRHASAPGIRVTVAALPPDDAAAFARALAGIVQPARSTRSG